MTTTFKVVVYADDRKRDGTYSVKIRVTHARRTIKVSTNLFVTDKDMTRGLKIKDEGLLDKLEETVKRWRRIVWLLGVATESMDVKQIVARIKEVERNGGVFKLDFMEYWRETIKKKSIGTARLYNAALNCLSRYVRGRTVNISEINTKFLQGFDDFIRAEPVQQYSSSKTLINSSASKSDGRASASYLSCLRHVHNEARREYNGYDTGNIRIPQSPFMSYAIKRPHITKKKAVSVETIQALIDLPDADNSAFKYSGSRSARRDLARDCFILSFALCGMNAADLYDCKAEALDETFGIIRYKRKKTRDRRADEAEIHIRIEPCIRVLIDKYRDKQGVRLFNFYKSYSSDGAFNCALLNGLGAIEEGCNLSHFTFYSARHSYATISRSKLLNIDKYTIHEGLNHVDRDMRITEVYIERDYTNIWDANAKLLALFDWSKLEVREMLR